MLTCHFGTAQRGTMLTSFNEWYIYILYVTGQHKNKAGLRQTWVYNPFASTHIWSIHNSYVSKMCIQNIGNIFAGFWIRACWICAKYAKINVPRIFPLFQYLMKQSESKSVEKWRRRSILKTVDGRKDGQTDGRRTPHHGIWAKNDKNLKLIFEKNA